MGELMNYRFHIQDPFSPKPQYLLEEIISQLRSETTKCWRGMFAFATGHGVKSVLNDQDVKQFIERKKTNLVVGVDAVTNPDALEFLKELEEEYENFSAKVFYKGGTGLFHPKISHFTKNDGKEVLIVGSGNLTPGGLKNNFEA